jgi:hypothetical protein
MVSKSAKSSIWDSWSRIVQQWFSGIHTNIQGINNSKIFAGLVVVTLNIASKFVNIRLSKTVEAYLKHTFSRDVLIFCIVWMGSREIYIAASVTLCFILFMDFLLNEDSTYCILPESFTTYHISLMESSGPVGIQGQGQGQGTAGIQGNGTDMSVSVSGPVAQTPQVQTAPQVQTVGPVSAQVTQPTPTEAVTHNYKPIQW